jgi:HD superfamily phosphohydrolase
MSLLGMTHTIKIIRDPIHGNIQIDDIFTSLLESPEIQRLYNIKQLGFAHLVFPGAHHSRLEHSLGAYYLATQAGVHIKLDHHEQNLVAIAALLHDIGHGPFSHTLESILLDKFGVDHIDLTELLISGKSTIFTGNEQDIIPTAPVNKIISNEGISHKQIIEIIRGSYTKAPYLSQLLSSTIDVDQLDYLVRDAHFTGVAYGLIDIQRFLQTLCIHNNHLAVTRKGVSVVENILMARALMYTSVYFHKTVRIAELMLSKACELLRDPDPFLLFRLTDAEIMQHLKSAGNYQCEIVTRLKYRRLFKQAYTLQLSDATNQEKELIHYLESPENRHEKEIEFSDKLGIPHGHIIIDVPRPELLRAEPRINQTGITVIDHNTPKSLDIFTPVAQAVRERMTPDWSLMIITDEKYRDQVSKKALKLMTK